MSPVGLTSDDEQRLRRCLQLPTDAAARGEVPVGAVVVRDGVVLGEASNEVEAARAAIAHAELEALYRAFAAVGEKRLVGASLYCSLEPCFQCAGAILHARVQRVVFAARDPKF